MDSLGGYAREIFESLTGLNSPIPVMQGLGIPLHDYISTTYTNGNPTTVVYKIGGSSGTVVATLTMTYDESNNLLTLSKS